MGYGEVGWVEACRPELKRTGFTSECVDLLGLALTCLGWLSPLRLPGRRGGKYPLKGPPAHVAQ